MGPVGGGVVVVAQSHGYHLYDQPGEGAFYGPSLEFVLRDAIGRDWQCGTLQVDLNLPERFDISYISEADERVRPVMLHRALFGSLERFIGILIEHHAGTFPAWLAPVQAVAFNITDAQSDYVRELVKQLKNKGVRVVADLRNELGYKVREHTMQRVPICSWLANAKKPKKTVSVRDVTGKNLGSMTLMQVCESIKGDAPRKMD